MDSSPPPSPDQRVLAQGDWERPPRRQAVLASAPVLAVDGFEGPLDWLLDLARTRRIDLAQLSIVGLVAAFDAALTGALGTADLRPTLLGRWSDWLVMVADLALLRSRMLVPADAAEVQDAHREAERLRQRVLRQAEIRDAADWLDRRDQVGRDVFARGQADGAGSNRAERAGDVTALLRACLAAIRLPAEAGALYRVPGPPVWSVADAAARIRAMLPLVGEEVVALEAFLPEVATDALDRDLRCRAAVAGTFLAGLELTREGSIAVQQETAWAAIQIRRGQEPAVGDAREQAA